MRRYSATGDPKPSTGYRHKHLYAAWYCAAVPVAFLLYLLLYGFPASLAPIDHFVLIAFALVWLRYSFRVIGIAKAYPGMPEHEKGG